VKAFVIHSRGALNATPCANNCAAAVRGDKNFTAFAGCISIAGEWNGACSNCVWSDHGAQCQLTQHGAVNGGGPPGLSFRTGGRAIRSPSLDEHWADADD
jgi:hypothetical protein